jgi:lipopolysaccharide transport system permease protein
VTVLRPPRGWQLINVGELWRFRELIYFLAWRDVKVRYKQTLLGVAWAVLQPLLMMVVFTIFFGRMGRLDSGDPRIPYPVFVLAGLLPWTFFSTAITNAGNSIIGSERLITKVYFPRLAIPFASAGAAVVDFVVAFGLLLVFMLFNGLVPGPTMLLAPFLFALIVLAATGVGTLLAALNVAYRDVRYIIPFLVQIWMFATPALYMQTTGAGGPVGRWLRILNPMNGLVAAFRAAALGDQLDWPALATSAAYALVIFLGACFYFRRVEDSFADVI